MFKKVDPNPDFPKMEQELLSKWYQDGIVQKYLEKNKDSEKKFSFLDGPITANNPMGVHHAWGRTYKDLWQRFFNMTGHKQRFQNGFDEQGLWVEVEVEKELGLNSKKEIENLVPGDREASIAKFINLCKARVQKYSDIQTQQSKRMGYFMDWDNSYHTSSDENNYAIWNFLKKVATDGNLYKGHDTVPWCPRCGTAISQHEILSEEYKELQHETVYFKLPLIDKKNEYLLVWTTTPWTIPANVAVAVNPKENYVGFETGVETLWLMEKRLPELVNKKILPVNASGKKNLPTRKGTDLLGWEYQGPFDDLELVKKTLTGYTHKVVDGGDLVTSEEGTGLLHVAPGAGEEDFKLAKEQNLPILALIEEDASYVAGLSEFSGQNAKQKPGLVINYLKEKDSGQYLLTTQQIVHRYPTCWRCKSELVWRVVDEWYIAMDRSPASQTSAPVLDRLKPINLKLKALPAGRQVKSSKLKGETYREQMVEVARQIKWIPDWGLDRELDWLKNMHDWLISKKRYWGLALPIFECSKCHHFQVIGSKEELREKAIEGWEDFEGHSPHRPWVDHIKIRCEQCSELMSRIPDVGNPWLDAGIVPFSTLPPEWFPADLVGESFPGQFKNWFYSMIAMATVLKETTPFKALFGYASMRDEKGEEMHKSKGNAIWFDEAADKIGVDVMRWLFATHNPELNLNFGYSVTDQVKRQFFLMLWNIYKFFVDYALVDGWQPPTDSSEPKTEAVLDRWILSRLNQLITQMTTSIHKYDMMTATRGAEDFVNDLSLWYVRRIRDRVGPASTADQSRDEAYLTLHFVLVTVAKLLAPVIPFVTDSIYTNLTTEESVHLASWPEAQTIDLELIEEMKLARDVVEKAHAQRKEHSLKVRQPLASMTYQAKRQLRPEIEKVVLDELNIKGIKHQPGETVEVLLDTQLTGELKEEGEFREFVRMVQQQRKELGVDFDALVTVQAPSWPKKFEEAIKKETLARELVAGPDFKVSP